ncbi:OmpA family protein [Aestuariicoccus sp. MJ-SS9]|uniref:OmpA family protein n=1 Tax=Aestuariicoccus sp. MJ-SS9 TaxID=3079855 RepID=UPI002914776D|nr:OmpA family protein [Aestuariicoccus sp. MJ-SS9]MDU8913843.1 OmpA family protein [Aestuariicoccus sp. MJ-SS9]
MSGLEAQRLLTDELEVHERVAEYLFARFRTARPKDVRPLVTVLIGQTAAASRHNQLNVDPNFLSASADPAILDGRLEGAVVFRNENYASRAHKFIASYYPHKRVTAEGRYQDVIYVLPQQYGVGQVMDVYRNMLEQKGFRVEFSAQSLWAGDINFPLLPIPGGFHEHGSMRYAFMTGKDAKGNDVHLSLWVQLMRVGLNGASLGTKNPVLQIVSVTDAQAELQFVAPASTAPATGSPTARQDTVTAADLARQKSQTGAARVYGINFDFDSDQMRPESMGVLQEIANLLHSDATLRLAVEGHTDAKGSDIYNYDLSSRRAASVVAVLVRSFGISPDRLSWSGKGEDFPVADNSTETGRALNRRVELIRLK